MKKTIFSILTFLTIYTGVNAQNVSIPDVNFKAYLLGNAAINTDADPSEISVVEASAFTGGIFCNSLSISDLTGIEAFTSLVGLNCNDNLLTALDVSAIASLQDLQCNENQLTTLSVVNNPLLYNLRCHSNSLTSLDLTTNPNLQYLHCYNNLISTISLPQSATLEEIAAGDNNLTAIDVSFNTGLELLELDQNQISTIDLSQNAILEKLYVRNNLFTSIDCSNNSSLNWIVANDNPNMQTFDISHGNNTIIAFFRAHNSPNLTCIQVDDVAYSTTNWTTSSFNFDAASSFNLNCGVAPCAVSVPDANFKAYLLGNAAINTNGDSEIQCSEASTFTGAINCTNQNISDLTGLEAFINLDQLFCSSNGLSSIDVTSNTLLTRLDFTNNNISTLDLSANQLIEKINGQSNLLQSLDLTTNSALEQLDIRDNSLTALDLVNNTALVDLNCRNTTISSLNTTSNINLEYLVCDQNAILSLDFSTNVNLVEGFCSDNSLTSLNFANGNNSIVTFFEVTNNPSLTCITVDDVAYSTTNWTSIDAQTNFNTNCSGGGVGINEEAEDLIKVYPNPVQNELFIEASSLDLTEITILDYAGRVVKSISKTKVNSIEVSDLKEGVYILRVSTEGGTSTNRFFKQ